MLNVPCTLGKTVIMNKYKFGYFLNIGFAKRAETVKHKQFTGAADHRWEDPLIQVGDTDSLHIPDHPV